MLTESQPRPLILNSKQRKVLPCIVTKPQRVRALREKGRMNGLTNCLAALLSLALLTSAVHTGAHTGSKDL